MLFCFSFHHSNSKSVTLKFFFTLKQVFSPVEVFAMDRFVSKRSSSSVDLDVSSLNDVRAKRAAIALSVGLSWPPDRHTKQTRGRPSRQQLWERALQDHILEQQKLAHVRAVGTSTRAVACACAFTGDPQPHWFELTFL